MTIAQVAVEKVSMPRALPGLFLKGELLEGALWPGMASDLGTPVAPVVARIRDIQWDKNPGLGGHPTIALYFDTEQDRARYFEACSRRSTVEFRGPFDPEQPASV